MKRIHILIVSTVLVLLLTACTQKSAPVEKPASSEILAQETQGTTKESWKLEWERSLTGAKKEGKVVIYSTAGASIQAAVSKAFIKNTGIVLEFVSGKGSELATKLLTERRAGLYLTDVFMGASTQALIQLKPAGALSPLEPALILPEVLEPQTWYGGKLGWVDADHVYFAFAAYTSNPISINTTIVRADEIKSYKGLLSSRWKGKILMNDPTKGGAGGKFVTVVGGFIMGYDYMRELAKQEPVILTDARLAGEWLARGKYPVGLAISTDVLNEFRAAGAPISFALPAEGTHLSSGNGNLGMVRDAPHPNAARVFVNWLLTREGQIAYAKFHGVPSARLDVPTEGMDPVYLRQSNVKYILGDSGEIMSHEPKSRELATEIFGPLMR